MTRTALVPSKTLVFAISGTNFKTVGGQSPSEEVLPTSISSAVAPCSLLATPPATVLTGTKLSCKVPACLLWNLGPHLQYFEGKAQLRTTWPNERQFRHLSESITACRLRSWERFVNFWQSPRKCLDSSPQKKHNGGEFVRAALRPRGESLQVSDSWTLVSELGLPSVFIATCRTRTAPRVPPESRDFFFSSVLKNVWT